VSAAAFYLGCFAYGSIAGYCFFVMRQTVAALHLKRVPVAARIRLVVIAAAWPFSIPCGIALDRSRAKRWREAPIGNTKREEAPVASPGGAIDAPIFSSRMRGDADVDWR